MDDTTYGNGLHLGNEELIAMIDNIPASIAVITMKKWDPVSVTVNRHLAEHLGVKAGTVPLHALEDLLSYVHPDDREQCARHFLQIVGTGGWASDIYRLQYGHTDTYLWVHIEGNYKKGDKGNDVVYLSYTDITDLKEKEEALLESRNMYDATVSAAHLLMWEYDIRRDRTVFSGQEATQAERRRFGWSNVIENAQAFAIQITAPEDRAKVEVLYDQVRAGQCGSVDIWLAGKEDHESRCERITYKVVRNAAGDPVKAYGIGQNITAEKKVEERYIREISAMQEKVASNLIAKGHSNLTKNTVVDYATYQKNAILWNTRQSYDACCAHMLQVAYEETDKQQLARLLDRKELINRYQKGEMVTRLRYRRRQEDGTPLWISSEIHTYVMPETGDLESFIYTYDVSAAAMKEQVIAKLSDLGFEELGLIDAVSGKWRCYRFLRQDSHGTNLWESEGDYTDDLERYIAEEVLPEERENVRQSLALPAVVQALVKGQGMYRYTNAVQRPNGDIRQISAQLSYLDSTRNLIFYCMTDVTEQFQHEHEQIANLEVAKMEAEHANEAKSAFLASVSHDLRTPLNGIIGFTRVALREQDLQKKQEYMGKVADSAHLLLDLVNDTLELSRIENGKMKLEPETINSRALGRPVITAMLPSADLKNIHVDVDVAGLPDEMIRVDKLKAQKIMLNVLSNAIKYTQSSGHIRFSVAAREDPKLGYSYRIEVEDNGIGMSEAFLQHLYEPFTQEKRKEMKMVLGTGLGLAIVKRIVDLLGGRITVKSQLGQGTCFTMDMPVQLATDADMQVADQVEDNQEAILDGKNILLVEDNTLNAEIASVILKENSMTVNLAQNGKEGVDMFVAATPGTYDMILMDIRMPVMDGYVATKAIRTCADRPDGKTIPIIALTADAFEEDIRHFCEAGMNGHVIKPINPPKLFETMAKNMK